MSSYTVRRLFEMVPVLIILSVIVFLILRLLPGSPISALIGQEAGSLSDEQRAAIERDLGIDKSLPEQYVRWAGQVISGDWGRSITSRQPVMPLIGERLQVTMQLAALAWIVAVGVGIPIGVLSALRRNSWLDFGINFGALAGVATPNFLLGLLLIVMLGVYLQVLPVSGFVSLTDDPIESLRRMAMPVLALSTGLMAAIVRQTRSAMLEVLNEDYIRTARAKGLSNTRVVVRHALKNSLLPVVTVAGLQIGQLASGTIIIETMFAIPGMGRLIIDAVITRDFAIVQAVVLILGLVTMLANLVADLTYVILDPRIRLR